MITERQRAKSSRFRFPREFNPIPMALSTVYLYSECEKFPVRIDLMHSVSRLKEIVSVGHLDVWICRFSMAYRFICNACIWATRVFIEICVVFVTLEFRTDPLLTSVWTRRLPL